MVCVHLRAIEEELLRQGRTVTFRGAAWSRNCREWVYFDGVLPIAELRRKFPLEPCVIDHEHRGTHDGQERGLVCTTDWDAIMGGLPD